ncbi:23S rRNA (guanosine2251-2'-O)-methyltransferase [Ruminococcus sp. YE71]|uniref:23S rRNA (guanosine(2251)-2'-O)-methyltransferase RlmB n=1 Tax=unclassified Ruminococcus TaxID=2608920 RepID=UPI00088C51C4|nr:MULTISPECIES: 23S rRNA (guanosine(2251)-2'-O)-methyltransferase RlmB [unclassified Ruminococcus]SDA20257.1 23S rRNA (guanosine2251-2'-O)-methyltransferase [Ruminococcus sp. YE78]SFW32130.1 23S rRNA (guanosine2251-2'-O)-methyltransferase [Ruminococcus sp. YE71]
MKKTPEKTDEQQQTLICGRNAVTEAIKSGRNIDTLYVNRNAGGSISRICALAKERDIIVKQVDDKKLDHMCAGAVHQGCAAMLGCAEYYTIEEILEDARQKGEDPLIIICDEIEDPHNLGAIIRTAEAAGAHGIIIPKRRSATLNYTVHKTSAGAASWIKTARVPNLAAAVKELKAAGVWIYGTDMSGDDIYKTDLTGAAAFVIGSEGFGMSRLMRENCDFLVSLPMYGQVNSLNASVAAGICMYEAVRQRRK